MTAAMRLPSWTLLFAHSPTSPCSAQTLVVDNPVISTAVEEPVQESVETIEDQDTASNPDEEAATSTSEPSAVVIEEPVVEEVATDDVAVEPPVHDSLLPIIAEGEVHPAEDIAEPASVLVQPVEAVEEPIMQESISDHVDRDEASASVDEPPILTATNTSEVSAESSELVSEEPIETIEEPVILDIPTVSQEPVVVEYSTAEVSAEPAPVPEEPQGLEEPVDAKDATEIEATEVVEALPVAGSAFVAEDTVDNIIAQPIDEASAALEDGIDTSKAINDELVEPVPVQDEHGINIIEEPIVADGGVASSLTGMMYAQDAEESTPANTEEPTTTVHEHITDVPADSTHRKYFGLLSSSRLLNMVS